MGRESEPQVPSPSDQAWLLEQLGIILGRGGWQRFVLGDVLEPSDHYFPDAFVTGPEGVATVARRLLWWAGVTQMAVDVVAAGAPGHPTAALGGQRGWDIDLAEVADDTLTLVLASEGAPPELPGALVSVVAMALRHRGRKMQSQYRGDVSSEHEEELATLQTIELGFGLLATEATQRSTTTVATAHHWERYEMSTSGHGHLPVAELAFLLAVQATVRETSPQTIKRWSGYLRPNQQDIFRRWLRSLDGQADTLRRHLAIPDPQDWPAGQPMIAPVPFSSLP